MIAEFRYMNFDMEVGLTVYVSDIKELMKRIERYDITPENIVSLYVNEGNGQFRISKSTFNKWFIEGGDHCYQPQ